MQEARMQRRKYLAALGLATTISVAGCIGGDDDTADGTADDTDDDTADTDDDTADGMTDDTADGTTDEPTSVTITFSTEPTTLDPHDHGGEEIDNILRHGYNELVKLNSDGEIVPDIAEDWEFVEPNQARFYLRDEEIRFHNGDEVTAEDVAYSINRIADEDVNITAGQQTTFAFVDYAEVAEGGDAVDVYTERFTPDLFEIFTANGGQVVNRSWKEEHDQQTYATDINGTGPFRLLEYEDGVGLEFEAFDDYWEGPPEIDELTITWTSELSTRVSQLIAGETDLIVNLTPEEIGRVQEDDDLRVEAIPSLRSIFFPMKNSKEPFTSVEFRQAMNYAYNQERVIDDIMGGFAGPMSQPVLEGFTGYNPELEPYPYDPELAADLVEESGFSGAEITITTPVDRYLNDVDVAQAFASDVNDLPNVSCDVQTMDFGEYATSTHDGDEDTGPDMGVFGYGNRPMNPFYIADITLTQNSRTRHYLDDEADAMLEEARSETDEGRREELLQELMAYYHEQAVWVFSHRQYSIYGVNERVQFEPRADEMVLAHDFGL